MKLDCDVVLFDAVGTLIRPEPSVAEVYHEAGLRAGSRYPRDQVRDRFSQALARHFALPAAFEDQQPSPLHRPETDEQGERRRWQRIVADVFDDVEEHPGTALFEQLWNHFAGSRAWRLWEDVVPTWEALRRAGLRLGVASNFDSRLATLCQNLPPLDQADFVFHSAGIGYPKPSPQFYGRVEQHLRVPASRILLVGDDWLHDVVGAVEAGWQAVFLERSVPPAHPESPSRPGKLASVPTIRRLTELVRREA